MTRRPEQGTSKSGQVFPRTWRKVNAPSSELGSRVLARIQTGMFQSQVSSKRFGFQQSILICSQLQRLVKPADNGRPLRDPTIYRRTHCLLQKCNTVSIVRFKRSMIRTHLEDDWSCSSPQYRPANPNSSIIPRRTSRQNLFRMTLPLDCQLVWPWKKDKPSSTRQSPLG